MAAVRFSPVPPARSEQEQRRAVVGLEPGHQIVPALLRSATVQIGDVGAETRGQVRQQHRGELGELSEQQGLVPLGEDLLADLLQPDHLAGPGTHGGPVVQ